MPQVGMGPRRLLTAITPYTPVVGHGELGNVRLQVLLGGKGALLVGAASILHARVSTRPRRRLICRGERGGRRTGRCLVPLWTGLGRLLLLLPGVITGSSSGIVVFGVILRSIAVMALGPAQGGPRSAGVAGMVRRRYRVAAFVVATAPTARPTSALRYEIKTDKALIKYLPLQRIMMASWIVLVPSNSISVTVHERKEKGRCGWASWLERVSADSWESNRLWMGRDYSSAPVLHWWRHLFFSQQIPESKRLFVRQTISILIWIRAV